ncbi:hypothetical protein A2U01_0025921, partial [Trifolium medium]|nr:hypothetical protein [Trifolium medium]
EDRAICPSSVAMRLSSAKASDTTGKLLNAIVALNDEREVSVWR